MEKPRAEKTYRIFKKIAVVLYVCIGLNIFNRIFLKNSILPWMLINIIGSLFYLTANVGSYFLGNPLAVVSVIFMIDDIRKKHGLWKKWLALAALFFASRYFAYAFYGKV